MGLCSGMKTNIEFNGVTVEMKLNERGILSVCSHWELIWDMKKAGVVELVEGELFRLPPATRAVQLGRFAFLEGKMRVPAWDKELNAMGSGKVGSLVPMLTAWLRGWDSACVESMMGVAN